MPVTHPAAHRLVLSDTEFALLTRRSETAVPAWFGIGQSTVAAAPAGAEARLREIGVLDGTGTPVPSVTANLAVLTTPAVTIRTEVSIRDQGLVSVHTIAGPLGASLISLAGRAVELTLFPASTLGAELRRAVPPLPTTGSDISDAFGPPPPVSGRLPLTALREISAVAALSGRTGVEALAEQENLSPDEVVLAREVSRRTRGVLWSLVIGHAGEETAVGQLVWLATDTGWVGMRPHPADGRRLVDLMPVDPADFGSWLAPDLATILDSSP
jgi:hypothetical protein